MMKKLAGIIRRLFSSRGFRRGTRFLFWVTIAIIIYNLAVCLISITDAGIPFRDALWFFFSLSPFNADFAWPFFIVIFLAIALGLICYFQGKAESRNTEEETEKEKLADLSDADQEEELSEPKHAQYH